MRHAFRIAGVALVAAVGAAAAAFAVSSCAATPTNVPLRSFQGARNVDYVCVAINAPDGGATLPPLQNVGLAPNECAQVPPNVNGSLFANHLVALVTQATRGEVAAVDLTAGNIIDESRDTPGTNFIPVGSAPTGIVVGADHRMTFVSSAAPNKPAIYGIPTAPAARGGVTLAGVLGDYLGAVCEPGQTQCPAPSPLQLTDLPACALPAAPQAVSVARLPPGSVGPAAAAGYVVVAVLEGRTPSLVAIDPTPFLQAAGAPVDAGAEAGAPGTVLTPGILSPCPILGAVPVSGQLPQGWSPGPPWPDGVPYADAGDLSSQEPGPGPCTSPGDDGGDDGGTGQGSADAGTIPLAATSQATPAPAFGAMRDDVPIYYVGDARLPLIHVFDFKNPETPVELAPLLATSLVQQTRAVTVGQIAISPPTRNYQRFLYAVDATDGSIMVFDVTDPVASPHVPLQRPHAELNPLVPSDRILFSAPVAAIAFAQHDWPVIPQVPGANANPDQVHASTGLLCNPNPNAHPDAATFLDNGAYYRVDVQQVQSPPLAPQQFPQHLRGIFGFATLTNGQIVTIDVDDWDAPCRRPDPMAIVPDAGFGMTGLLDLPQPDAGPDGSLLDPYAAPFTEPLGGLGTPATTQEAFFPVSAPNRTRSNYLLRNDPTSGNHAPNLVGAPALSDENGAPVSSMAGGVGPVILPTELPPGFIDPSLISDPTDPPFAQKVLVDASTLPGPGSPAAGVRLSFDDPTVSSDQDWSVTYEGVLPSVNPVAADMQPGADGGAYETLTLTIGQQIPNSGVPEAGFPVAGPGFCERGVEDWDLGKARASEALAAMAAAGLPEPPSLAQWTADYVEIVDDLMVQGDTYWNTPQACWDGLKDGETKLQSDGGRIDPQPLADARYNACFQAFGAAATADTNFARDLPILRAYDDHLDVGRFYWPKDPEDTRSRTIVGQDPGNVPSLKFLACCFHNQVQFKVRTGGEWVAAGQSSGLLHHVIAQPGQPETDPLSGTPGHRCVLSCDPRDALLNARSFDIPWANIPWGSSGAGVHAGSPDAAAPEAGADAGHRATIDCSSSPRVGIGRNSPLAMHNPYFSYVTWMGCGVPSTAFDHTLTPRGYTWKVQVRGGFSPLVMSLTGGTLASISPQSMLYIQPLGQLAVVDGESQGLVLIDLSSLQFAHTPYF